MNSDLIAAEAPNAFLEGTDHWAKLGYKADPYYGHQLPVTAASVDLLVGRQDERHRLKAYIAAYPTGKTMIQGAAGVGKTSLVNVVQWELYAATRRFPLFDVVETAADANRESFLLAVMSGLISSLRQVYGETDLAADEHYRRAEDTVTQTLRHATNVNLSLSVKLLTAGGARTPLARAPLGVTSQALVDLLRGLISSVSARGFEGVVVPVNNLDILSTDDVITVLNTIRDVCGMIEGVHWVFIGGPHLFAELEDRARRISENFTSNPIDLPSLRWQDAEEALERRRAAFAQHPDTPLPISSRIARLLYEAGNGELRFMFTRLSRTVMDYVVRYPSERVIPDELALDILRTWAFGQLARFRLSPKERQVVDYLASAEMIRPRDHRELGISAHQQLSKLLKELVAKGYVRNTGTAAGSEYRLTAAALLSVPSSPLLRLSLN